MCVVGVNAVFPFFVYAIDSNIIFSFIYPSYSFVEYHSMDN